MNLEEINEREIDSNDHVPEELYDKDLKEKYQ